MIVILMGEDGAEEAVSRGKRSRTLTTSIRSMPEDNSSPCKMTAFFISSFAVLAQSAFNSLKCVVYNRR